MVGKKSLVCLRTHEKTNKRNRTRYYLNMCVNFCGCAFIISACTHLAQQSKTGYDTPSTDRVKTDADTTQ